jgi:predicted RNase H-like HicB family nuclease
MSRYLVVIEQMDANFSAYAPDLPGCVATGDTREETLGHMKEAIAAHLSGLGRIGQPLPEASASAEYLRISSDPEESA